MVMPVVVCVASSTQPTRYSGAHDVLSPQALHRGQLERLLVGDLDRHVGAEDDHVRDREHDEERQREREVGPGQVDVALLEQVPRADAQHQRGARPSTTPRTRGGAGA